MAELKLIAATVGRLAKPGMKPKELISAVRDLHPEASKKDVTRAAFYAVILASEGNSDSVASLHELAIQTRSAHDDSPLDDH